MKLGSLNRPGGNVTGVNWFSTAVLASKQLELLHELVPEATVIGFLVEPNHPGAADELMDMQQAARNLGKHLLVLNASTESEIDTGIATLAQQRAGALLVGSGGFFVAQRNQIIALAARLAVPAIYSQRESVAAGGLISYSSSAVDAYRRAGVYVSGDFSN